MARTIYTQRNPDYPQLRIARESPISPRQRNAKESPVKRLDFDSNRRSQPAHEIVEFEIPTAPRPRDTIQALPTANTKLDRSSKKKTPSKNQVRRDRPSSTERSPPRKRPCDVSDAKSHRHFEASQRASKENVWQYRDSSKSIPKEVVRDGTRNDLIRLARTSDLRNAESYKNLPRTMKSNENSQDVVREKPVEIQPNEAVALDDSDSADIDDVDDTVANDVNVNDVQNKTTNDPYEESLDYGDNSEKPSKAENMAMVEGATGVDLTPHRLSPDSQKMIFDSVQEHIATALREIYIICGRLEGEKITAEKRGNELEEKAKEAEKRVNELEEKAKETLATSSAISALREKIASKDRELAGVRRLMADNREHYKEQCRETNKSSEIFKLKAEEAKRLADLHEKDAEEKGSKLGKCRSCVIRLHERVAGLNTLLEKHNIEIPEDLAMPIEE